MGVRKRRGKFDGSEKMLDRFVGVAQLLEDTAQVEFGKRVPRFVLDGYRKLAERFLYAIQLIQSGAEVDMRINPLRRGVDSFAICIRGLLQGFSLRVAGHAQFKPLLRRP